jgi:putative PIN family toxin of toxin-antitoxin system
VLKIICDTNIIVSSLIQRGYPYHIVYGLVIEGAVDLCLSEKLLREYVEVLKRDKFAAYPGFIEKAESVLAFIKTHARMFTPKTAVDILIDKDDNMLLELAEESAADFLITGNTVHFTVPSFKNTQIVSPRQFWEHYLP